MKLEKVTKKFKPTPKRQYEDACATAHALDLIGERWALLVMRELLLGPKRFRDLRENLPGISANVLTQRLEGLESVGIVIRRLLPPPTSAQVYGLTPWGYESEPIFQAMGRWAARSPSHDPTLPFSAASLVLSMRTMFAPEQTKGLSAKIGFQVGREPFLAQLTGQKLTIDRSNDLHTADVIFTGAAATLAAVIYGGQPMAVLEQDGSLTVEGDRGLAEHYITLFPLPPKIKI